MDKTVNYDQLLKRVEFLEQENAQLKDKDSREQLTLLAAITDSFPNAYIAIIDADFTVSYASGQQFEKSGLDSNDFVGLKLEDILGEHANIVKDYFLKTFKGQDQEFELFRNDKYHFYKTTPLKYNGKKINKILVVVENITEKKLIQQQVEESLKDQQELADIMKRSPLGIAILDAETNIVKCNEALSAITGYSMQELTTQNRQDILTPKRWIPVEKRLFKKLSPDHRIIRANKEIIHKNGSEIPVNITAQANFDPKGNLINFVAFLEDISARIDAQKEIKENQETLNLILDNIPFGIYVHDLDGNIKRVNQHSIKDSGFSREELLQMSVMDIDQDVAGSKEIRNLYNIGLKHKGAPHYRNHLHKNGDIYPVQINLSPFKIKGEKHIVAIAQNITEHLQLQHDLQAQNDKLQFISSLLAKVEKMAKVGGWQVNLKSQGIYWTDEVYEIHDTHRDTFTPTLKTAVAFYNPESIPILTKALQNAMDKGETIDEKLQIISAKGTCKDVWVLGYAKNDSNGNPEAIYGVIQDITEQRKGEIELLEAKKKAEVSDLLKSAFIANMSHEIRTPLNAILGFSQLLKKDSFSQEKNKMFIDQIEMGGKRLLAILSDILDISRIDAKELRIDKKDFNLNKLLNRLRDEFMIHEFNENCSIQVMTGHPDSDYHFKTDPNRLSQIFSNLIENAIKYTKNGTITLGYVIKKNELEFYVRDTGTGIHEADFERIFERFTQLNLDYTKSVSSGTGLGLPIVKNLVNLLGGKIWVDSKIGRGSTFFFTLPLEVMEKPKSDAINPIDKKQENNLKKGSTILIAEDQESNFLFLETILAQYKVDIIHAKNGQEAVDLFFENKHIDLILMDIKMPIMDGFEATQKIRERDSKIPIVAVTAYAMEEDQKRILNAGFTGFVSKPVEVSEIDKILLKFQKE